MKNEKITKREFLNLIKDNVKESSYHKLAKIVITPKCGWDFEISANITELLYDDIVFISNAFNNERDIMTIRGLVDILSSDFSTYDEKDVVFEIYGYNRETGTNEQIIINYANKSNISFYEDDMYVQITMSIDSIKSVYSTKCNNTDIQFVIQKTDQPHLYSRWNGNVIVFDTIDEINEHIKENHYFYAQTNYKIIPKPESFQYLINYKDIANTEEYRESCVYEA